MKPDHSALGRWLKSWVQPDGSIHGFHNHTVWGENPYHYQDMTCTHSTFAAPMMVGLAYALRAAPDPRGVELLRRMIRFQTSSFQPNGMFEHVGFNAGEMLKVGLIHNVAPDMALGMTAFVLGDRLDSESRKLIDGAVRKNLAAVAAHDGAAASMSSCANQEYCRQWAKLAHMLAFEHKEWDTQVERDIAFMIEHFHVRGLPDDSCAGSVRGMADKDNLEPAEYYGLMIAPLVLAAKRYSRQDFFDAAISLCRHVIRSAWTDAHGRRRFHRDWHRVNGEWHLLHEPMLIGGMGFTLAGMQAVVRATRDAEIEAFLDEFDRTYAAYQSPAGSFLAATGWKDFRDLIPSTAWQSHDFFHLVARHGADAAFWNAMFRTEDRASVVLGPASLWVESPTHFAVRGYFWATSHDIIGRKDQPRFYVDIPVWMESGREPPADFKMPEEPQFLRTNDAILHHSGRSDLIVYNHTGLPYRGPGAVAGEN